jgi:hypothetical protein
MATNYIRCYMTKQVLAARSLFNGAYGPEADFAMENIGYKKVGKGNVFRKKFVENMKDVDGYVLQNIYDNYNTYYCMIKNRYKFIPFRYRDEIDFKVLDIIYERI